MNEVSPYIADRTGASNKDQFEGQLYEELVVRLGELRKTSGIQIPLSRWTAWVIPAGTVVAILATYLLWIVPKY